MELGSSPRAAAVTLERLLLRESVGSSVRDGLQSFLGRALSMREDAKSRALLGLLRSWSDKLLIFTRFRATQEHLTDLLREVDEPSVLYHGGLRRQEKEEAIRAFEGPSRILISTEAGGEGRNLQFAHGLVNYDLPWNPMRIEQRIGRLSRVGQTRDVYVFNLVAPGTIEETLLEILLRIASLAALILSIKALVTMTSFELSQRSYEDSAAKHIQQLSDRITSLEARLRPPAAPATAPGDAASPAPAPEASGAPASPAAAGH